MKVTKLHRFYFQLAPSTLPTEETGFGLLLTPTGVDIGLSETRKEKRTAYRKSVGRQYTPGCLTEQLMHIGLLPTPATRDYKGARSTEALESSGRTATNSLPDAFHQTGKSSQLNPRFVMEMMGFPPDWTELPFLSGGQNPLKQEETQ